MAHIVLLGDSIFDNSKYVRPAPDVAPQLQQIMPPRWKASLRAVDGALTSDVPSQIVDLPGDATHLALKVGGNDLLGCAGDLLRQSVSVSSEVFLILARVMCVFESMYRYTIDACLEKGLPLIVCAI